MTITFSAILICLIAIFKPLQKNNFFVLYFASMLLCAYIAESFFNLKVLPFSKFAFMYFILCHIPLINLFTFVAYGRDKHYAKIKAWRIPEVQLHALELLGGSVGAVCAQNFFIIKIRKNHIWQHFLPLFLFKFV